MAYPTKYTRQYGFQAYQDATPNRPLPGDKVDADYNAVEQSIDEIVEFLKLHSRSDGALLNGVVTVDSLSDELAAALGVGEAIIAASEITFTPTGGLASTNVAAALAELDTEKAATSHTHAAADITSGTLADARISASSVTQHAAAVAALLDSDDIANVSTIAGANLTAALDAIAGELEALGTAGVSSVFGRSGAVVAVAGDYAASTVDNDSGVAGSTVADALDTLEAAIVGAGAVTSVFGRTGAVVAATSDYDAVQVDFTATGGIASTNAQDAIVEVGARFFATRTAFAAATIPASVTVVQTAGYSAAGDGGGGTYTRQGSEPSHPGKVQSAGGTWWELQAPGEINVMQFGAATSGDNTDAIDDAIAYVKAKTNVASGWGRTIVFPVGQFSFTQEWLIAVTAAVHLPIRFRGQGGYSPGGTRLVFAPSVSGTNGITILSGQQIVFEDFEIVSGNTNVGTLIEINAQVSPVFSGFHTTFRRCYIRPLTGSEPIDQLIHVLNAAVTEFDDCWLGGTDQKIRLGDTSTGAGSYEGGNTAGTVRFRKVQMYIDVEMVNVQSLYFDQVIFARTNSTTSVSIYPAPLGFVRHDFVTFLNCSQLSQNPGVSTDFFTQEVGAEGEVTAINNRLDGYRYTFNLTGGTAVLMNNAFLPPTGVVGVVGIVVGADVSSDSVFEPNDYSDLVSAGFTGITDNRVAPKKGWDVGAYEAKTIASGAITVTKAGAVKLDTEAAAAADDLDTINGGKDGRVITLRSSSSARDVTVKTGTGNITLSGGGDFVLDGPNYRLTLIYDAVAAVWYEIARSGEALATTTAVALKANLASPTFTGTPAAPTPADFTDSTQIATTAFVSERVRSAAVVSVVDDQVGALLTIPASEMGLLFVSSQAASGGSLFAVDTIGTNQISTLVLGTSVLNGGLATPVAGDGTDGNAIYYIGTDNIVRVSNRTGSTNSFGAVFIKRS